MIVTGLPREGEPIAGDKPAVRQMSRWMQQVTDGVNVLEIIEGVINPEGAVDAPKKKLYFDSVALKLYFKTTPAGTLTGWIALN